MISLCACDVGYWQVPIFMKYSSFPLHIDPSFNGRMRHVDQGSIELRDLRPTDQDWYECSIVSPHDTTKETISNRIYLSVTCRYMLHEYNHAVWSPLTICAVCLPF